jgi:alpha-glucosidase (family GH31 glycosyl hydrolase)
VAGKYHFLLGDDLLVAPIYQDQLTNTVQLPPGRWRPWFQDTQAVDGPTTLTREFRLDDYPVYVRDGAIIPLNVSRAYTGFGDAASQGFLTWVIYPQGTNEFTVHHPDRSGTTRLEVRAGETLTVSFRGVKKPHILRIRYPTVPQEVLLDGKPLAQASRWRYEPAAQRLWVKTQSYEGGLYVIR